MVMAGFSCFSALSASCSAALEEFPLKGRKKPTLSQLILRAAAELHGGRGASLAAMKKMLQREGYDVLRNKARIRAALRYFLNKGVLLRVSGRGVSGSFRLPRAGGAPAAENKKSIRGRKSSKQKGAAAAGPRDSSGKIKPAAARPTRVSRNPGKIRGTVATRRKQILEEIIKGTFLMKQ